MPVCDIPSDYVSILDRNQTQEAIEYMKEEFLDGLREALRLKRASAPLFLPSVSGMNDDLDGQGTAVRFHIPDCSHTDAEVVQSLAKWKRFALYQYGFAMHEGIVTDMNAIRKDEVLDNLHSVYVDQWDWELVISEEERTQEFLYKTVERIVAVFQHVCRKLRWRYPALPSYENEPVHFIHAQELENLYPDNTPEEREYLWGKNHKITFLQGIGGALESGSSHGKRAADYDDWNLNGDLLIYDSNFDRVVELSSMGIRVNSEQLLAQLQARNEEHKLQYKFHRYLMDGVLPQTIGGGIGQSRMSLLLLGKAHIGEVQSSVWDEETLAFCKEHGVNLL